METKGLKRVLSLVLSFALVFATGITTFQKEAKAAEKVVFSVTPDKTTLHRGDTFTVSVAMSGNTAGEGLTYDLVFDETKLELQGSEKGDVLTGQFDRLVEYPSGKNNAIRATVLRDGEAIQNGTIMTASFKVKDKVSGNIAFDSIINFLTYHLETVPHTITYPDLNIEVTPTGISLDKESLLMSKGAAETLTATVTPADASGTVKWSSDNESVATVTQEGEVRAVAGGTANITATIGRYSATCAVTVNVPLTGISIADAPETINRGESIQLEAVYAPEDATNKNLYWVSSDPSVASVDEKTGLVTGIKEGTAIITVTTEAMDVQTQQPFTASVNISVKENHFNEELAQKVTFTHMKDALLVGQKVELTSLWNLDEIISDNDITDKITVTWSSENSEIATVNANGTAFGIGEGKTTITALITAEDGAGIKSESKAMIEIEVKRIPLHSIAFDQIIHEMKVGEVVILGIIYDPAETTDSKEAVWTSSDSSVISVEDGVLKALKPGNAEITAKVGEKTVSCNITVKSEKTPDDSSNTNSAQDQNKGGEIKTGDPLNVAWAVVLMFISGAAILAVMRKRISR